MKRLAASIVFVALLVAGIVYVSSIVRPNEDRDGSWITYKRLENNSIDVLLTGSSKIHANINPVVMWKSNRFTSYDISGSSMDLTTMSWYLREAFKTQHPKVVVIDILLMGNRGTTLDDIQMRNIMDMPFGLNKLSASLSASVNPTSREKVLFPMEQFHSRVYTIQQISRANYLGQTFAQESPNVFMGYRYLGASLNLKPDSEVQAFDKRLFERHYRELKKSLDFLKQQKCKVLLVNTPSAHLYNLVKYQDALENRMGSTYPNVDFYWPQDYENSFKIDYKTEMLDYTHLNAKGADRFSRQFGEYLKEHYTKELSTSVSTASTSSQFNADYVRYCSYKAVQEQGK